MVYVEEVDVGDGESPNDRHGNKFPEVGDSTSMPSEEADAAVFGELFPRICELRPPDAKWNSLMEKTLVNEWAKMQLIKELQPRVRIVTGAKDKGGLHH